jgi:GxxExxY protein
LKGSGETFGPMIGARRIRTSTFVSDLQACEFQQLRFPIVLSFLLWDFFVCFVVKNLPGERGSGNGARPTTSRKAGTLMAEMIYKEESYRIMGACFEVYKEMGCGFLESVYQECLQLEFNSQGIPAWPQQELLLRYKGELLEQKYAPDFICFEMIILEIKAVNELAPEHRAQVHNYLHATGHRLGLLVNFGHYPKVEYERIVI